MERNDNFPIIFSHLSTVGILFHNPLKKVNMKNQKSSAIRLKQRKVSFDWADCSPLNCSMLFKMIPDT